MVRSKHNRFITMTNQTPDHDILITLVESVKNNHTTVMDKIGDVKADVAELKDVVNLRIVDHEIRIKALEKLRDEVQPETVLEIIRRNDKWINDFKLTWKVTLGIASTIAAIIGFILATVVEIFKIFGK